MITTDGGVKVLDFGLAKMRGATAGDAPAADLMTGIHTEAGGSWGRGFPLDHRTDIFSLGVVLHEMATGQRPFRGVSSADLFASINALRVNLPGQFWTHLVLAMVHGQLGNRDAAADALRELLAIYPDFPDHARQELEKFFFLERAHAEHVLEGLRKAGLTLVDRKH